MKRKVILLALSLFHLSASSWVVAYLGHIYLDWNTWYHLPLLGHLCFVIGTAFGHVAYRIMKFPPL